MSRPTKNGAPTSADYERALIKTIEAEPNPAKRALLELMFEDEREARARLFEAQGKARGRKIPTIERVLAETARIWGLPKKDPADD